MTYIKKNGENKTERIMFRLTKDLKTKIEDLARKDNRTMSDYVYIAMLMHVAKINREQ